MITYGKTREYLDRFLSLPDRSATAADYASLIKECPKEDLYLDYKSGREFEDGTANSTLRQYVSGFANSEGGTLVLGYHQRDKRTDGCGDLDLYEWATRTLQPIIHYFAPRPRLHPIEVEGKKVLIVATPRSPALVPLVEKSRVRYFLRFGDTTEAAPDYLATDLILGRRNRARLEVKLTKGEAENPERGDRAGLVLGGTINNLSIYFAKNIQVGYIAWIKYDLKKSNVSEFQRSYLDVRKPVGTDGLFLCQG